MQMKKKWLVLLSIIITVILILSITFFIVDNKRVINGELPIFAKKVATANDGGTTEYMGLGYKVIDYNKLNGYDKIHIGSWFMKYNSSLGEDDEEEYPTFIGTVLSSDGIFEEVMRTADIGGSIEIIVEPDENEPIRKSSDKISVILKEYDGNAYDPGTKIKVTYDGQIMETYPARVKAIKIKEIENKTIEMYKVILKDIMEQDSALNTDAKFIAIDFENFFAYRKDKLEGGYRRPLTENERKTLIDFLKQYNENVMEANFGQLRDQGYYDVETHTLAGLLISVDKIDTIKENKCILRISKYRSALGAIMPRYELNLINDYYWNLKVLDMMIS